MISKTFINLLFIVCGALLLCAAAWYNGYPLVYPDTGTYIAACFQKFIPIDRPIAYSFFIKHNSLSLSLWLPIFTQSLILSALLFKVSQKFYQTNRFFFIFYILILIVSTGVSYISSELLPDIFTSILILAFVLIWFGDNTKWENLFLYTVFSFSMAVHFSNILLIASILGLISIVYIFKRQMLNKEVLYKFCKILILAVCAIIINPVIGFFYTNQWVIKPQGSHAFMINRLYVSGILKDYLDDECISQENIYCEIKDFTQYDLLWDAQSPLNKHGGWMSVKKETEKTIAAIFSNKKYVTWILYNSVQQSLKQLISFDIIVHEKQLQGAAPYGPIEWHFARELDQYTHSKQNQETFSYEIINKIQKSMIPLSLLACLLVLFLTKAHTSNQAMIFYMILCMIFMNGVLTSTFGVLHDRFTSRVIWLIPFLALVFFRKIYCLQTK